MSGATRIAFSASLAALLGACAHAPSPSGTAGNAATVVNGSRSVVGRSSASSAAAASDHPSAAQTATTTDDDGIFYHVFVRSFRDSDGDLNGDLRGILDRLDYLQSLGVGTVLLTPLYPSPFYHNYFATDFDGIDAEFGTMDDFRRLVAGLHARGMKLFLDEEVQYTDDRHVWYTDSRDHPGSRYADFILYDDPRHHVAASGPFGIRVTKSFGNRPILLTSVNLKSPRVLAYFKAYFRRWVDPDGDGDASDGVDGFRIDHMMDDLDGKGVQTDLFATFWRPVFDAVRTLNPKVRIVAEQADWGYGGDFLTRGDTDYVFAFPLHAAIRAFDRDRIAEAIRGTAAATPAGKRQLLFVENHDTSRIASDAGITPEKLRTAAALNLLLAGTPIVYYGQELGMRGRQGKTFDTDENDIGQREAFRWDATLAAPGNAIWYRGPKSYWTQRAARDHDGVSVAEQDHDPDALLSTYRRLAALRRAHVGLRDDAQRVVDAAPGLLVVERGRGDARVWLLANLTPSSMQAMLPPQAGTAARDLLGRAAVAHDSVALAPYQTALIGTP